MKIKVGQLRRWKKNIPAGDGHAPWHTGKLFLIVSEPKLSSYGQPRLLVEYLQDQELHTEFVTWVTKWSISVDETG